MCLLQDVYEKLIKLSPNVNLLAYKASLHSHISCLVLWHHQRTGIFHFCEFCVWGQAFIVLLLTTKSVIKWNGWCSSSSSEPAGATVMLELKSFSDIPFLRIDELNKVRVDTFAASCRSYTFTVLKWENEENLLSWTVMNMECACFSLICFPVSSMQEIMWFIHVRGNYA